MSLQRASGVLLHPTSLPSAFGIGDLGRSAYEFVDFLHQSGQTLWQVLPLGPTGYEHSPYTMNFSAFAGNPLLVDLEQLVQDGLLEEEELVSPVSQHLEQVDVERVDFEQVIPYKTRWLELAYERFQKVATEEQTIDLERFRHEQADWLNDFGLYMALREANGDRTWNQWASDLVHREPAALEQATNDLRDRIQYHIFVQYLFFQQWKALRTYANHRHIRIIGDVSIYVCHDSADVWAHPKLFKLDPDTLAPSYVAGVPPDYFSATGQLWGNPVYNWERIQQTGYNWWIRRFQTTLEYVDIVRIDHFRGFEAYWQIPAGEPNAIHGEWVKAPGEEFFEILGSRLGELPVLAEDLGIITPEVEELRDRFQFPGMRILQFAFDGNPSNTHLPYHHVPNSVVYTGTHDNDTARGWWESIGETEKNHLAAYLGYDTVETIPSVQWMLIRMAMASPSRLAIFPLQDLLGLGGSARMNDPSKVEGNWRWRYTSFNVLTQELSDRLLHLTNLYDRAYTP